MRRGFKVESFVHLLVNDLDFTSIYPTLLRVLNISSATLKFAVYKIDGMKFEDIQSFFSRLVHIRENSVSLCEEFFNLPNYTKASTMLNDFIKEDTDEADNHDSW